MVGILLSYWEGLFSVAMLVSGRLYFCHCMAKRPPSDWSASQPSSNISLYRWWSSVVLCCKAILPRVVHSYYDHLVLECSGKSLRSNGAFRCVFLCGFVLFPLWKEVTKNDHVFYMQSFWGQSKNTFWCGMFWWIFH